MLPICEVGGGDVGYFVSRSLPSPPRGIPEYHWQIDFDFVVMYFILDATQDLLAAVPRHDNTTLVLSFDLSCAYTHELYYAAYLCALSTCQPHSSANGGVLRLEAS